MKLYYFHQAGAEEEGWSNVEGSQGSVRCLKQCLYINRVSVPSREVELMVSAMLST